MKKPSTKKPTRSQLKLEMEAAVADVFRNVPKPQGDPLEYDRSVLQKVRRERSSRDRRS